MLAVIIFCLLAFIYFPDELAEFNFIPEEVKPVEATTPLTTTESLYLLSLSSLNVVPVVYYKLCQLTSKSVEKNLSIPDETNPQLILFFLGKKFFLLYFIGVSLILLKAYSKQTSQDISISLNLLFLSNALIGYKCFTAFEKLRREKCGSFS